MRPNSVAHTVPDAKKIKGIHTNSDHKHVCSWQSVPQHPARHTNNFKKWATSYPETTLPHPSYTRNNANRGVLPQTAIDGQDSTLTWQVCSGAFSSHGLPWEFTALAGVNSGEKRKNTLIWAFSCIQTGALQQLGSGIQRNQWRLFK